MHSFVFSIIVPAYNISGYIEECVGSMCPAEPDWEIIIVDDGSTDDTGEICDSLAESHDNVTVVHKENGGLSSARNCGLEKACGRYVIFVDGDDYVDRQVLASLKDHIQGDPDVVFCETLKVWEDGKRKPMGDGITSEIDSLEGAKLLRYLSHTDKLPGSAWGKAFNRDFLMKNELFFREGLLSEDIEWSFRLYSLVNSAVYCKDTLYFYRQNRAGSITSSGGSKHAKDLLGTVEKYAKEYDRLNNLSGGDDRQTALRDMYRSFLEYELRVLLIKKDDVKGTEAEDYKRRLKALKYLTGYRKDNKSRLVALLYRVLI